MEIAVQAPKKVHAPVISRLKIMSNMDIAEHRIPQDGRLKVTLDDADVDFRVSSLPTIFGEKIVMRILDKRALRLDLNDLGFNERAKQHFLEAISQPNGIVLVTGPTGSGKSTTLYSALGTLNGEDVNLVTVEDPVEYNIHGINQVQVNAKVGLTFASALRSILRQDPDIVMLGEIRDGETAAIAIQAALTGHLVLSTLHTNDAPSSISRLFDMGVEPFLLSASLNLCQAQRLIRKICPNCKSQQKIPGTAFEKIRVALPQTVPDSQIVAYAGEGCDICDHTGCKGRTTLVEVLPVGPELKELIAEGAPVAKITTKAKELGFQTLFEDGLDKILRGVTSIEEVFSAAAAG
jgi:type IV pilus assembly protein PilB